MRVRGVKKEKGILMGYAVSFAALILTAAVCSAALSGLSGRTGIKEEEALKKAVTRATVQCYAIEGRYPPSVDYLEKNYGIQIDRKKYNVFYDGFASNVMPDISIIPIGKQGAPQ